MWLRSGRYRIGLPDQRTSGFTVCSSGERSNSGRRRTAIRAACFAAATLTTYGIATAPAQADGPSDIAIWRPANATWYLRNSATVQFGRRGDIPVPADYNGDGKADVAVWRPSNGTWYLRGGQTIQWGKAGDVPVPADYNGDGKADLAVWRPSDGTWYVRGIAMIRLGQNGDRPVPADYSGDHKAVAAVWRPSNGAWYIYGMAPITLGQNGDRPVPADYLSYDHAQPAVWRPSNGTWYIRGGHTIQLGRPGDTPLPGDYDANGTVEPAVWRPSTRTWYVLGASAVQFGSSDDVPVPANYANRNSAYRLAVRTLTLDGGDVSAITRSGDVVTMTAPTTNNPLSNLRKVFWPTGQVAAKDRTACATWVDQSDGVVQQGVALRISIGPNGTRALTVTKNVIYGVQWQFNVHSWDSSASSPFTVLARYDMSAVVTSGGQYVSMPWRICARTVGASLTFKVWIPARESEPSWTDPVHARTTPLPDDYLGAGTFGWYIGHLPAGGRAHYSNLTVSP